jgi:hypothetical protein
VPRDLRPVVVVDAGVPVLVLRVVVADVGVALGADAGGADCGVGGVQGGRQAAARQACPGWIDPGAPLQLGTRLLGGRRSRRRHDAELENGGEAAGAGGACRGGGGIAAGP